MSAKDLFGVIVRTAGLLMCVYGGSDLIEGVWDMFANFLGGQDASYTVTGVLIYILAEPLGWLAAGALFMRRPDRIVRFAYPYRSGACAKCGYDMRATPGRCPECGTVPETT